MQNKRSHTPQSSKPALAGLPGASIDLEKLSRLTHAHRQRSQTYRAAAKESRRINAEADALLADMLADASETGESLLSSNLDHLAQISLEDLHAAHIDPYALRRFISLRKSAAQLGQDLRSMAQALQASRVLTDRLIAHARAQGEFIIA